MMNSLSGLSLPTCSICNDAKMLIGAVGLFAVSLAFTEAPMLGNPGTMASEEVYQSR